MGNRKIEGKISYRGIPYSRAIRRYVEKQLQRWIDFRFPQTLFPGPQYSVSLRRVGDGHVYNCRAEVRVGSEVWASSVYGEGFQQALLSCLTAMHPILRALPSSELTPALA